MREVFVHAFIATFLSVLASLGICWVALTAVGAPMDGLAVILSVVCPVAVAFPASAYNFNQRRKIALAHAALTEAHGELALLHKRLAEKARLDEMTGLLNRAAFIAAVEEMRAKNELGSLLLIDADNFKQINDTFGHLAGDEALQVIARAVRSVVRAADVKGRLGGEEFGVFIAGANVVEAFAAAERVRRAVEAVQFRPNGQEPLRLTVSIGVAVARTGAGFSELMGEADKRLYEAKRHGRNRVAMSADAGVPV